MLGNPDTDFVVMHLKLSHQQSEDGSTLGDISCREGYDTRAANRKSLRKLKWGAPVKYDVLLPPHQPKTFSLRMHACLHVSSLFQMAGSLAP